MSRRTCSLRPTPLISSLRFLLLTIAAGVLSAACGGRIDSPVGVDDFGEEGAVSAADEATTRDSLTVATLANGSQAQTTTGLNLRRGPSTNNAIILTMSEGSQVTVLARSGSWYSVDFQGTVGWCHGGYLEALSEQQQPPPGNSAVDAAMNRARSGLGFSYHWGGGCWSPGSTSYGACYGSCPNCSHSGTWGADCSGYVTKVWQVPGRIDVTSCGHGPYSSTSYYETRPYWTQVSRSGARRGDAFVRRGHIFLYNSGDPWGSINALEAKGCSYGILQNNRTADSTYLVIRREGF